MKIRLSDYEIKLDDENRQFIVIADPPKITPQLGGMIITTASNMLNKYQGVDPAKVEDLNNLITIIKNSIK